jgi:very-short-patch-repair endonuclease
MIHSRIINESKQNLGANSNIKNKARELRKSMTEPEKILWSHLRKRKQDGIYFRRQHPFGIYILDLFCFEANLVIEIDGMIHLSRRDYDIERTKYLESSGLKVIRFYNRDIENRIEWVLDEISSFLVQLPHSQLSTIGKGLHSPQLKNEVGKETIISPLGEIRKGVKKLKEKTELTSSALEWRDGVHHPVMRDKKGGK